jgi:hypothetical protein
MHDGALPHFGQATAYLNQLYGYQRVFRAGPISWPLRAPDLIPLDLFLRGLMKETVYST